MDGLTLSEAATFVVKAMAGAVLSQGAKDAYGAVRDYLNDRIGIGTAVTMLEENPAGETEQKLLAERLTEATVLGHSDFRKKVEILVEELKRSSPQSTQAIVLIEEIKGKETAFRNIIAEGSGSVVIRGVDADKSTFDNIKATS